MCEFELIWFVTMWMIVFTIVLVEYFFPNGEGYTVSVYVRDYTQNDKLVACPESPVFAFRISALLYQRRVFHYAKGSFIEYYAR